VNSGGRADPDAPASGFWELLEADPEELAQE
jgi:hypothetical protein